MPASPVAATAHCDDDDEEKQQHQHTFSTTTVAAEMDTHPDAMQATAPLQRSISPHSVPVVYDSVAHPEPPRVDVPFWQQMAYITPMQTRVGGVGDNAASLYSANSESRTSLLTAVLQQQQLQQQAAQNQQYREPSDRTTTPSHSIPTITQSAPTMVVGPSPSPIPRSSTPTPSITGVRPPSPNIDPAAPNGHATAGTTTATAAATSRSRLRNRNQLLRREWRDWGRKRNYKQPATEHGEVGWEPGIDVRNTEVVLGDTSTVTIVDYNSDRYRVVNKIDKHSIDAFLKDKQDWATVRWINVNGLSWEVLRSISAFYNLHPLAVEDMVDIPKRAKADHYKNQTFCTLPLHKLVNTSLVDSYFENLSHHSELLRLFTSKKRKDPRLSNINLAKAMAEQKMMTMQEWNNPTLGAEFLGRKRSLQRYHEVVAVEQVSIFLIEDNTVISFFENSAEDVEGPLLARITSPSTLLREYPEPSLLLQAILDGIVDIALRIISEYQKYIVELQNEVLTNPKVSHTRDLHILSEELSMLRSTLMPIYGLVQALRDHASMTTNYLTAAAAAAAGPSVAGPAGIGRTTTAAAPPGQAGAGNGTSGSRAVYHTPGSIVLAGGQISEFAKLYLSDVADHVMAFTDNIDLMRHTTENMINLIFNTMSVQENEAMRQLTLVTILFLPLTFLTGFFGMNFTKFKALEHTTVYFWVIAIPVTVFMCLLILWPWTKTQFARVRRYYAKRAAQRKHEEHRNILHQLQEEQKRNLAMADAVADMQQQQQQPLAPPPQYRAGPSPSSLDASDSSGLSSGQTMVDKLPVAQAALPSSAPTPQQQQQPQQLQPVALPNAQYFGAPLLRSSTPLRQHVLQPTNPLPPPTGMAYASSSPSIEHLASPQSPPLQQQQLGLTVVQSEPLAPTSTYTHHHLLQHHLEYFHNHHSGSGFVVSAPSAATASTASLPSPTASFFDANATHHYTPFHSPPASAAVARDSAAALAPAARARARSPSPTQFRVQNLPPPSPATTTGGGSATIAYAPPMSGSASTPTLTASSTSAAPPPATATVISPSPLHVVSPAIYNGHQENNSINDNDDARTIRSGRTGRSASSSPRHIDLEKYAGRN
ncbi:uncharacterized protein V1518DRAFT_410237 [Limtongia smithiae]|uniref:uncharacterized protein n=1 Tax=Limtongia smithiae TaxID=1125753 RepID=UPI0034CF02C5